MEFTAATDSCLTAQIHQMLYFCYFVAGLSPLIHTVVKSRERKSLCILSVVQFWVVVPQVLLLLVLLLASQQRSEFPMERRDPTVAGTVQGYDEKIVPAPRVYLTPFNYWFSLRLQSSQLEYSLSLTQSFLRTERLDCPLAYKMTKNFYVMLLFHHILHQLFLVWVSPETHILLTEINENTWHDTMNSSFPQQNPSHLNCFNFCRFCQWIAQAQALKFILWIQYALQGVHIAAQTPMGSLLNQKCTPHIKGSYSFVGSQRLQKYYLSEVNNVA